MICRHFFDISTSRTTFKAAYARISVDTSPVKQQKLPFVCKMGSEFKARWAALARDTNETKIQLALNLDGGELPPDTDSRLLQTTEGHASQASSSQKISVNTGIGFLDHMLHALAKHAGWSMALNCQGDLHSTSAAREDAPPSHPR